ncbi:MAG TPA: flagellar basal-body rod protein FlgF [Deltaproteobacteria bacterium]|nr:MAG: flagellar basal-body rod protein FlgF [Deltaproteobacteria bacterium GWA2_55_82]OGQ62896.1 MAG: flagellar basal-body rod protein FlgF [Deltaproteobacteria bacterium RIFCSPLOWO2_02_FULL_55_12]OIJ72857.1 MAG: flagellar basal-body rod protein FlgF [Deltaproteobacteria bacterium GWC2_55_46]HBG46138.1 flagellar basal-body rod protein FlgF [Deltaproteobacteria bacterium]HCY11636.1 flagellar basal-body rod protein FlgF [Deltaproteobacteria bacterium]
MDKGIFVALSGAVMQERRMEALTDNLANVNTAGFKAQRPLFEDAITDIFRVRTFGKLDELTIDMGQGHAQRTERKLDVAINGDGFFVVETPSGMRYTRDGSFTLNNEGNLVTMEGYPVMGDGGRIKLSTPEVLIDGAGAIHVNGAVAAKLKLASFIDTAALRREGGFFAPLPGAKETPASPNTQVEQGYIEASNVNAVRAMTTMIEAMRSYETNTKLIQSMDDMTRKAIEEVGRT